MPRPVPVAVRKAIWNRFVGGDSARAIAEKMHLSRRTVTRLIRQFREMGDVVGADYQACGLTRSVAFETLRRQVLELREAHPHWGSGRIRIELQLSDSTRPLPSERSIQRWLHEEGYEPAKAGRRSAAPLPRAVQPHRVWQVDAAEQKRLANGREISWLRVVDECSGAVLKTVVFPPRALPPGTASSGSTAVSPDLRALGTSPSHSRRQRCPVGNLERSASPAGVVDHRTGH